MRHPILSCQKTSESEINSISSLTFKVCPLKAAAVDAVQCDQIGRFIALWATISKPVAIISLPNSPTFLGNF